MSPPQVAPRPAPIAPESVTVGQRVRVWLGSAERPRWQLGRFQAWRGDTLEFVRTDLLATQGRALVPRDSLVRLQVYRAVRGQNVGGACLSVGLGVGVLILVPTIIAHADGQPEAEMGYYFATIGALAGCAVGSIIGFGGIAIRRVAAGPASRSGRRALAYATVRPAGRSALPN